MKLKLVLKDVKYTSVHFLICLVTDISALPNVDLAFLLLRNFRGRFLENLFMTPDKSFIKNMENFRVILGLARDIHSILLTLFGFHDY